MFIPNIVNEYPDIVSEGWSLNDTIAFIKEYKLNLIVADKNGNTIPEDKYNEFANTTVIEQSRPKGDAIIEGITLKIKINATYTKPETNNNNDNNETNNTETN